MVSAPHQRTENVRVLHKRSRSQPNPPLFFFLIFTDKNIAGEENCWHLCYTSMSEGQLILFLHLRQQPLQLKYANSKFSFGRGGIFPSNLSGETSALHNLRLYTSGDSAHYYWLASPFIQSHFVSRQFLAFKCDAT